MSIWVVSRPYWIRGSPEGTGYRGIIGSPQGQPCLHGIDEVLDVIRACPTVAVIKQECSS